MGDSAYVSSLESQLQSVNISKEDREKVIESFLAVDENKNGFLDIDEVKAAFEAIGKAPAQYKIRDAIRKLDTNNDNRLSPAEFAQIYGELCSDSVAEGFKVAVKAKKDIVTRGGHSTVEGTQHSYDPREMHAFGNWINQNLKKDPDLKDILPIDTSDFDKFCAAFSDGIILCKMINLSQKGTIDERAINKGKKQKAVQMHKDQENLNLALNSASAIGCSIVNIGASDIKDGKAHLILGLLWQVIRIGLFAAFDLTRSPALAVLLKEGEELEDLMNLAPELLLLRWMNYQLEKSSKYKNSPNGGKEIKNFSGDIKDSYAYLCLLEQIQPGPEDEEYADNVIVANLNNHPGSDKESMMKRAKYMLNEADKIGCRAFVTEGDVAEGISRLNMAFVANLFNTFPALEETEERELIEETREEKTYRNWMNSLGVSPRVYRLYNDLKDGVVFAQLFEKVKPGVVPSKFRYPPFPSLGGKMKKIENCNCIVQVGKDLKYSLVGIDGSDLNTGERTGTLSLTWQIMRGYTLSILESLTEKGGVAGDKAIIEWTNQTLVEKGKSSRISSFKDSSIRTSIVVLDLIDAIAEGSIDYSNVSPGDNEEEQQSNARYAISMGRKIGAKIYALPDDLWEVNQKMVMTIFACLMVRALQLKSEEGEN
ncbi:plastin-2-like [Styela clava]